MNNRDIHNCLRNIPGLAAWPEVLNLFPANDIPLRTDWALPTYTMKAAGLTASAALPIAAALACIQISIMLVDDILDDDPRGKHISMGVGRAANLALALQAAAHMAVDTLDTSQECRYQVSTCLQEMALDTAAGQELDMQPIVGESGYWRLVSAKSTPFYAAALESGAILGGVSETTRQIIRSLGVRFGEIIQIMDDLDDAFQSPAKPDWQRQDNNLVILYAKTALHPAHLQFLELLDHLENPGTLVAAQQILIDCGAVSYCLYQIIQRLQESLNLLHGAGLPNPQSILSLYDLQIRPLATLLRTIGVPLPQELQVLKL